MMVSVVESVPKYPKVEISYSNQQQFEFAESLPLPLKCKFHLDQLIHDWRETYYTHACVMDYKREGEKIPKELYNDFVRRVLFALSTFPSALPFCTVPFELREHADHFELRRTQPPFLHLTQPSPDTPPLPRLLDCLRFSPAKMSRDSVRPIFVLFQVWLALREYHRRGFMHGGVSLSSVLLRDDCAVFLSPPDFSRVLTPSEEEGGASEEDSMSQEGAKGDAHHLPHTLRAWLLGELSNFDYLMYLNRLAGRRMNDPLHHPILPWVIDFSRPDGEFRDLSRSMFRLNKGDHQLDLQFAPFEANDFRRASDLSLAGGAASQVPHHVTDFISDITYYSYKARRIAKEVLVRHVRPNWQPNEYPSSMSRMYKWTPDECIPEFFTDPDIFISRHKDMKDLEMPSWCPTPAAFLRYHRAVLESEHVSAHLHEWIDLTFGYKLSGEESVQSKNVCLQLVDGHTDIRNAGVVQLFKCPHPRRLSPSRFFRPEHPLLCAQPSSPPAPDAFLTASMIGSLSTPAEEHPQEVNGVGDEITRSRSSRSMSGSSVPRPGAEEERTQVNRSLSSGDGGSRNYRSVVDELLKQINLETGPDFSSDSKFEVTFPPDYDPLSLLRHYEEYYRFVRTTSKVDPDPFPEPTRPQVPDLVRAQHEDVVAFACLVVEVFAFPHTSPEQCRLGLDGRVRLCQRICYSHKELIPKPFHELLDILNQWEVSPTASTPHVNACTAFSHASFPTYFEHILAMLLSLREALSRHDAIASVDSVSSFLLRYGTRLPAEALQHLLLPVVVELLRRESTRVTAAVRLLLPLSSLIGPEHTNRHLRPPLLHSVFGQERPGGALGPGLPNCLPQSSSPPPGIDVGESEERRGRRENVHAGRNSRRCFASLFHVSFQRQLLRGMGLRRFLAHMPQVLVEALSEAREEAEEESESSAGTAVEEMEEREEDIGSVGDMDELAEPEEDEELTDVHVRAEVTSVDSAECALTVGQLEELDLDSNPMVDEGLSAEIRRRRTGELEERSGGPSEALVVGSAPSKMESFKTFDIAADSDTSHSVRESRLHSMSVESCGSMPSRYLRGSSAELASESVLWLSERLGPYLCSKFFVDNLLRMLVVCYADADSLNPLGADTNPLPVSMSVANRFCVGDRKAAKVFHCLRQIACLYGEQMILLQYLPFVRNCIHSAVRGMTVKVQAGLLASVVLLQQTVTLLPDNEFTANLQEPLLKELVSRAIRLTGSLNTAFPAGACGRSLCLSKLLDLLYTLGMRLGFENTRVKMAAVLQQFFAPFSKVFSPDCQRSDATESGWTDEGRCSSPIVLSSSADGPSSFVEIRRDTRTNEFTLGTPVRVAPQSYAAGLHGMAANDSPRAESPLLGRAALQQADEDEKVARVRQELAQAYSMEMAHLAYVTFCRLAGGLFLKENLYNGDLIIDLYERCESVRASMDGGEPQTPARTVFSPTLLSAETAMMTSRANRHLKGNWLSYWEHEKGRDEANKGWFFKHMRLMGYRGHTASVRGIQVLKNESSFFSYSKDKTVRLWSIHNCGEGEANTDAAFVYRQHHKPVVFAGYISAVRLIASVDGVAHLWDPFTGTTLRTFSAPNLMSCGALCPLPSACVLTGEADGFVRLIDARVAKFVAKWHTASPLAASGVASAPSLRHLAASPNGWAVACASGAAGGGALTWLDTRSGIVNPNNANSSAGLRFGDAEVTSLRFVAPHLLLVNASDLALRLFSFHDAAFPPEVRHQLLYDQHRELVTCYDVTPRRELVVGTAGGRLGVYASPDASTLAAPLYTADKLRSAVIKGVPSALALLPSNQLALVGSDHGNMVLLA